MALLVFFATSETQYPTWLHSDYMFINTTPDGANIPAISGAPLSYQIKDWNTASGLIGNGRRFAAGQGIKGGNNITTYSPGSSPHTTQAWFNAASANSTIQAWGIDGPARKVVMKLASPPHMSLDSWFENGNVSGVQDGVNTLSGIWTRYEFLRWPGQRLPSVPVPHPGPFPS